MCALTYVADFADKFQEFVIRSLEASLRWSGTQNHEN